MVEGLHALMHALVHANLNSSYKVGHTDNDDSMVLNYKIGHVHFFYLGLPIGGDSQKLNFWKPLVEWDNSRLSWWKSRNLSFMKYVSSSLLIYWDNSRLSWWKSRNLSFMKYVSSSLLIYFISFFKASAIARYGEEDGFIGDGWRLASGWWSNVLSIKGGAGSWFTDHLQCKVGDGVGTFFWRDPLLEGGVLKDKFIRFFNLSDKKMEIVEDMFLLGWGGRRGLKMAKKVVGLGRRING
uniref:RNA-directed DNA polymerase, related n=1 Tax=Medicago truncatula TaxID=3880 RepID=Q2HSP5_MEDTR|nr:RNA-directed DNA polymerase, related [Medicago truncatula]